MPETHTGKITTETCSELTLRHHSLVVPLRLATNGRPIRSQPCKCLRMSKGKEQLDLKVCISQGHSQTNLDLLETQELDTPASKIQTMSLWSS